MPLEGKPVAQLTPETLKNFEDARQALLNIHQMPEGGGLQDLTPEVTTYLTSMGHAISFDQKMATPEEVAHSVELLKKMSEAYAEAAEKIQKVI